MDSPPSASHQFFLTYGSSCCSLINGTSRGLAQQHEHGVGRFVAEGHIVPMLLWRHGHDTKATRVDEIGQPTLIVPAEIRRRAHRTQLDALMVDMLFHTRDNRRHAPLLTNRRHDIQRVAACAIAQGRPSGILHVDLGNVSHHSSEQLQSPARPNLNAGMLRVLFHGPDNGKYATMPSYGIVEGDNPDSAVLAGRPLLT
jgi:hypothetical protein